MLTRAQIKENAKAGFRAAYWPSVGALVLVFLIFYAPVLIGFIPFLGPLLVFAATIILVPLSVGMFGYYLGVYRRDGDTRVGRVFNIAFSQNFGRKLGGMMWMALWSFLWMLIAYVPVIVGTLAAGAAAYTQALPYAAGSSAAFGAASGIIIVTIVGTIGCMVPAIIKTLSYSMTPFILADCPDVLATNALTLSKRMTKGYKGEIFVMGLSFIGWALLTAMTFGILGIFWTGPYYETSLAGLYDELKRNAVEKGLVSAGEYAGELRAEG